MAHPFTPGRRVFALGAAALLAAGIVPSVARAQQNTPPPEGGIGGTGIVGLLTGTAPLSVNGLSLSQDPQTIFRDAFGAMDPTSLRPGQNVTVLAQTGPDGALRAALVERTTPLVGTLQQSAEGVYSVNGVALRTEPGVGISQAPGARVAVSGLWDGDRVVVSRVDSAPPGSADVIAGTLTRGLGGARVAGVPIDRPAWLLRVPDHGFGTFVGRYTDGRLEPSQILAGRFRNQAARSLRALSVEGYLEPADRPPGFRVSGLGHSFDPAARLAPVDGERVLFEGPYRETFRVATGLVLPENAAARGQVLGQATDSPRVLLR